MTSLLNHLGGTLDPHAAFLLQRSVKTLGVRVRQQNSNALALALFLEKQPQVGTVSPHSLRCVDGHVAIDSTEGIKRFCEACLEGRL